MCVCLFVSVCVCVCAAAGHELNAQKRLKLRTCCLSYCTTIVGE